jgi:hypothetical protein
MSVRVTRGEISRSGARAAGSSAGCNDHVPPRIHATGRAQPPTLRPVAWDGAERMAGDPDKGAAVRADMPHSGVPAADLRPAAGSAAVH